METVVGTVTEIALVEKTRFAQETPFGALIPLSVKATVRTATGENAYVETQVGTITQYDEPTGERSFAVAPSQKDHPWAVWGVDAPVATIWEGDLLILEGQVTRQTSRRGNPYLEVKRARVTSWRRPEWEAQAVGPEKVSEVRRLLGLLGMDSDTLALVTGERFANLTTAQVDEMIVGLTTAVREAGDADQLPGQEMNRGPVPAPAVVRPVVPTPPAPPAPARTVPTWQPAARRGPVTRRPAQRAQRSEPGAAPLQDWQAVLR